MPGLAGSEVLKRSEKPVTFYAYTDGVKGKKLARNVKIILYAREIEDRKTGAKTFDLVGQRVAKFLGGVYQTDIIDDIEFLRNYNKNNRMAKVYISEKFIGEEEEVKIVKEEVIKTKRVIPSAFVKSMTPDQIRQLLRETFSYEAQAEDVPGLVLEGEKNGYFE